LPDGFTKDDFLRGYSLPVNPELIRVFRDLGYAERLGTGIRRVLRFYPKEIFGFSPSFLRVNVPFGKRNVIADSAPRNDSIKVRAVEAIKSNPSISRKELGVTLGKSESTAYRLLNELKEDGVIVREGGNRTGSWVVVKGEEKL
jgi:predicted HTH transcriptional regulator